MAAQSLGLAVNGDLRPASAVTIGATADQVSLKAPVKQVRWRNTHATQTLVVNAYGGDTEAQAVAVALAANTANAITAAGTGAGAGIIIAPGETLVVWKSKRSQYVCLNAIASGATTTGQIIGTLWSEGS